MATKPTKSAKKYEERTFSSALFVDFVGFVAILRLTPPGVAGNFQLCDS